MTPPPCEIPGCTRPCARNRRRASFRRWCSTHLRRKERHGSPLGVLCVACRQVFEDDRQSAKGSQLCDKCLAFRVDLPGWVEECEYRRRRQKVYTEQRRAQRRKTG